MRELTVWAPKSKCVWLSLAGEQIPMESRPFGWGSVAAPDGHADYAFILDDGAAIPDPRSFWQPYGVHGPSRMLDHRSFHWTDQNWQAPPLASGVIYELHIGTFTPEGTFAAAIA